MITFKLPTLEIDDIEFILGKQDEHSWAYHYCYKTYDESCDDSYEERIKSRFGLNDIECRSVMSDVKSDREKELTQKENKKKRIEELEQKLETVSNKGKVFRIRKRQAPPAFSLCPLGLHHPAAGADIQHGHQSGGQYVRRRLGPQKAVHTQQCLQQKQRRNVNDALPAEIDDQSRRSGAHGL